MEVRELAECLKMLNILASETRLKILCIIGKNRLTGVEILKQIDLAQPSLSHHLTQMVNAGILNGEEKWKWTYYSINNEKLKEAVKSFKMLTDIAK